MKQNFRILIIAFLISLFIFVPICESISVDNVWTSKTPMQQERGALGVASVDGKIYAIGGSTKSVYGSFSSDTIVATNEEYNPASNNWTTKAPMPTPRAYLAVAVFEGKIYCFGGTTGMGMVPFQNTNILLEGILWSNATEVYNPAADTWEKKAAMPADMQGEFSIVVVDGLMYFIGTVRTQPANVYNPATDTWDATLAGTSALLKSWNNACWAAFNQTGQDHGDCQFAATNITGDIYTVSNSQNIVGSKALSIYNTQNQTWRLGPPAPENVAGGAAVATSGVYAPVRAYFESPTANYVYNPQNNSWTTGTPLPTYRFDFGITILDDKIYVIGGFEGSSLHDGVAVNEQYTPFGYKPPVEPTDFQQNLDVTLLVVSVLVVAVVAGVVYLKKRRR